VRGGRGTGKYKTPQPPANFKTLVNKNEIKPEIGDPPLEIFPESLAPLGILAKTSGTPSTFNPCASMPVIVTILQMIFNRIARHPSVTFVVNKNKSIWTV
jgi:hypothetical protein